MTLIRLPDGVLPPPRREALPAPAPLRAMLGPGIILLGLSLGSGEFILWPRLTAEYGFAVFWACWVGVTIQFFLNMEIERYTLATGESAVTGFVRLWRGFGPVFLVCATVPWIWPGWATGGATLLTWEIGGPVTPFAVAGLILSGLVLSLGPVVYRTIETVQIVLVVVIFALALALAALVVRGESLAALAAGALRFGQIPDGIDMPLLLGALAFAGAGGTANLAQSNYIKDKGYGMGRWIGRITSPFTGRDEAGSEVGAVFEGTPEELDHFRVWWRRANIEHLFSFWFLCVLSLCLFCLLTHALLGEGAEVAEGLRFIDDQGAVLEERFGALARHAFIWAGIAVLFSTELGLLDAVSRVVVDLIATGLLRGNSRFSLSQLYIMTLWTFIAFGVGVLALGLDQPLQLLVLSASLNAVVMFLYSGLLLWLGWRCFEPPLRPGPVRVAALCTSFLFFGYFSAITIADRFF
ncbi:MAG: Nramp family divalent metal transporter [Proteobacteria bacterium]|nr:Nramp family divalent metal transporter [Pseudomonadota bacterium]